MAGRYQPSQPSYDTGTRIESDLVDPDDASLSDLDDPLGPTSDRAPLNPAQPSSSTRSGGTASSTQNYLSSRIPGEDRRAPTNTIDESVWATLSRDLRAVWEKMHHVLWPKHLMGGILARGGSGDEESAGSGPVLSMGAVRGALGRWPEVLDGGMSEGLRDWDLWGPLLFSLLLSFLLSRSARNDQRAAVFSGVFAIVWIGEAVVTMQIKLLGGSISFFQSVCIIGYTLFPLVIASLLSSLGLPMIPRIPVYIALVAWSLAAGISILGGSGVVRNRVGIAVYPLLVFYISLGCLCFIS
ncbi:Yip1-domain-containing protein [Trichodelitschia bisporula]|uniref:Protein YIP n=1 Tax=Trichodelitschia bisporula TaxID=703511 RepID=A0A6G1I5T6_9PEZI|nr:Yip1-domain-containing protein [Trichodelitschia bisporula]